MARDGHDKRLAETKTKERLVLWVNNTFFLMLEKRLKRPTKRSEAALCLPLCTVWSRSGCPWPPSSESSRCRAASHRHAASWRRQTPQKTWLWSVAECSEAPRGRLAPTWMWCHFLRDSHPWIMRWTKHLFDTAYMLAFTHFTSRFVKEEYSWR